jgi:hypothetical protein
MEYVCEGGRSRIFESEKENGIVKFPENFVLWF